MESTTYTPDGRALRVEVEPGESWVATCEDRRGTGATACEAMLEATGVDDNAHVGPTGPEALRVWVEMRAAQVEAEAESL